MGGGVDVPEPVDDREKPEVANGVADRVHPCRQPHREDPPEPLPVGKKIAAGGPQLPIAMEEEPQRADRPAAVADQRAPGQTVPTEAWQPADAGRQGVTGAGVDEVHDRHRHQSRHHVAGAPEDRYPDADDHHRGEGRDDDREVLHRQGGALSR